MKMIFFELTGKGLMELQKEYDYKLNYYDYKFFVEPSINNVFSKSFYSNYFEEKGFTKSEIVKDLEKINSRLELHINNDIVDKLDDGLYYIKPEFYERLKFDFLDKKEFKFSNYDKYILGQAEDNIMSISSHLSKFNNLSVKSLYNKERMYKQRCLALEKEGFIVKLDDDRYLITEKSIDILEAKAMDQFKDLKPLVVGRFDKQIYTFINDNNLDRFTLDTFDGLDDERLKVMMKGRVNKLINNGYIVNINGELAFRDKFIKALEKDKYKKLPVKLNKYDINKIFRMSDNYIISNKIYTSKYLGANSIEKEIMKLNKRLDTLEKNNYVAKLDDGSYKLNKSFINEAREYEKKLVSRRDKDKLNLCNEQKFILDELRQFLNISQEQLNTLGDYHLELTNLYNRGLIDYSNRVINGVNTKVFFLTKEGKQITSRFTGVEVKDMHESKIHHRPQELEHDVLVYSAYQDVKQRLFENNKVITNVQLDRDMRRNFMKIEGKMIHMADLRVEYKDVSTRVTGYLNVEVELGYSSNVIADEDKNVDNMAWYTNSESQKQRIMNVIPGAKVIML